LILAFQKIENKYVADNTTPGLAGGGGTEVWTFKAVAPGSGQLIFTYKCVSLSLFASLLITYLESPQEKLGA
jgi:predicted secreted protein